MGWPLQSANSIRWEDARWCVEDNLERSDPEHHPSFAVLSDELLADIDEHFSPYVLRMPTGIQVFTTICRRQWSFILPNMTNLNKRFGELTSSAKYAFSI